MVALKTDDINRLNNARSHTDCVFAMLTSFLRGNLNVHGSPWQTKLEGANQTELFIETL